VGNDGGDIEHVRQALAGDDKAFEQLLLCHRQRILGICLRLLGDRIEAEEAAQESFVKIYFHLKDFNQSRDFSAWAASIAMNECRDRLRRRVRRSKVYREVTEFDSVQETDTGVIESQERLTKVEKAIETLPSKLKEVLVLKAYGNYGYDEIAQILKVKIGTVMSRLFRARRKLTDIVNKGDFI
jgi:RNA polymerase sigma factor (sigma-70 family)